MFTSNRDGNSEIYVMNADGTAQTRLTTHAGDDFGARWTRSGRILFGSDRSGVDLTYVMNLDGTGVVNAADFED